MRMVLVDPPVPPGRCRHCVYYVTERHPPNAGVGPEECAQLQKVNKTPTSGRHKAHGCRHHACTDSPTSSERHDMTKAEKALNAQWEVMVEHSAVAARTTGEARTAARVAAREAYLKFEQMRKAEDAAYLAREEALCR